MAVPIDYDAIAHHQSVGKIILILWYRNYTAVCLRCLHSARAIYMFGHLWCTYLLGMRMSKRAVTFGE